MRVPRPRHPQFEPAEVKSSDSVAQLRRPVVSGPPKRSRPGAAAVLMARSAAHSNRGMTGTGSTRAAHAAGRMLTMWVRAVEEAGGIVTERADGGILAQFASPVAAAAAAVSAERSSLRAASRSGGSLTLCSAAIHVGRVESRPGQCVGASVDRCARLLAVAQPGQIVLSTAAARKVIALLPDTCGLRRLGAFRLPGEHRPEVLWQVVGADLPADFATTPGLFYPPNVPAQIGRFIGRSELIQQVVQLLDATTRPAAKGECSRLVALTGAGGSGKTRLAVEAACAISDTYSGDVWFVPLTGVRYTKEVLARIAEVLGIECPPDDEIGSHITARCRARPTLLVLDNLEHLLASERSKPELFAFFQSLLAAAPALRLLITSRIKLSTAGETVVAVPPLETPPCRKRSRRAGVLSESERLFVARVRELHPSDGTPALLRGIVHDAAVTEICRLLEGLPLAIRLVAGHVGTNSTDEIAEALRGQIGNIFDKRYPVGSEAQRHASLCAALGWSFHLLPARARRLLPELAALAGEFDESAACAICTGKDVLDNLRLLASHSWIVQTEAAGRFSVLEVVRAYAQHRSPEVAAHASRRHLVHYCLVAENLQRMRAKGDVQGATAAMWRDLDQFRGAFLFALESGNDAMASRLAVATGLAYIEMGLWEDARTAWEDGREAARRCSDHSRVATLLHYGGNIAMRAGNVAEAGRREADSLAEAYAACDRALCARALVNLASIAEARGECEEADRLCARALEEADASGDRERYLAATMVAGSLARERCDFERAEALFGEARAGFVEAHEPGGIIMAAVELAELAAAREDAVIQFAYLREALDHARAAGLPVWIAAILRRLGDAHRWEGDVTRAALAYTGARRLLKPLSAEAALREIAERLQSLAALDSEAVDRAVTAAARLSLETINRRL